MKRYFPSLFASCTTKRTKFLFVVFMLLFAFEQPSQAQVVRTSLWPADSIYDFSLIRRYDIEFELNKTTLLPKDSVFLDSLADYLHQHPEIYLEIGVHTMYVPPERENHLSMNRSSAIAKYLVDKGSAWNRFYIIGYGAQRPVRLADGTVLTQKYISSKKSQQERDSLNRLNRRVEFRVRGIIPLNEKLFTLTDSVFIPGNVLRSYNYNIDDLMQGNQMRPENTPFLDSIAAFLIAHPTLIMEVGAYTDSRGDSKFDKDYSQKRAELICNYIIGKGISKERVIPVGYGQSLPLYSDEIISKELEKAKQEYLHQQNRRVEFKIIHN